MAASFSISRRRNRRLENIDCEFKFQADREPTSKGEPNLVLRFWRRAPAKEQQQRFDAGFHCRQPNDDGGRELDPMREILKQCFALSSIPALTSTILLSAKSAVLLP